VKLEIWSPLPPARSGVADHVAETLPYLVPRAEVGVVVPDPSAVEREAAAGAALRSPEESDRSASRLYVLGNSRWHGFAYREAVRRPGVLLLHEWSLHGMVFAETFLRGDASSYRRLMRERYGTTGGVLAGQAMGGFLTPVLESLLPLSEHVVERSRGVAATTRFTASRAALVRPAIPVGYVPLHASLPLEPLPSRLQARAALGLPPDALVVTAPGLVNPLKRIDVAMRAVGRVRRRRPGVLFVVAGDNPPALPLEAWARAAGLGEEGLVVTGRLSLPDLARHLVAADVVLSLRFPSLGEMSAVLLRALAAGRPVVVTAATPACDEFPEGVVVPVDPGAYEEAELEAVLDALVASPDLREAIGARARAHVLRHHDPARLAESLLEFVERAADAPAPPPADPGDGLPGALLAELRRAARELGLPGVPEDVRRRVEELASGGTER
jgi:glycosyltransferase involved in cell wall biosynthesis